MPFPPQAGPLKFAFKRLNNSSERKNPDIFCAWIKKTAAELYGLSQTDVDKEDWRLIIINWCQYHNYSPEQIEDVCRQAEADAAAVKLDALAVKVGGPPAKTAAGVGRQRRKQTFEREFAAPAQDDAEPDEKPSPFIAAPAEFPIDCLAKPVADYVTALAVRHSLPISAAAVAFFGLCCTCIGQSRVLHAANGYENAANLWIGYVHASGGGKSPLLKDVFGNLYKLQDRECRGYAERIRQWERADRDGDAGPKPIRKALFTTNFTIDGLIAKLIENPRGIAIVQDDMKGFMELLGSYGGNADVARQTLLHGFALECYSSMRKNAGDTYIERVCLSIIGFVQPDVLKATFACGGLDEETGLLARFLFLYGRSDGPGKTPRKPLPVSLSELNKKLVQTMWSWDTVKIVYLNEACTEEFCLWADALEHRKHILGGKNPETSRLSKLKYYALRFSLILHCVESVLAGSDGSCNVSLDCLRSGLRLAEFFHEENMKCLRLYGAEPGRIAESLETQIMRVILADENCHKYGRIQAGTIVLALEKDYGLKISTQAVGKKCSQMGLTPQKSGDCRFYYITPEHRRNFEHALGRGVGQLFQTSEAVNQGVVTLPTFTIENIAPSAQSSSCKEVAKPENTFLQENLAPVPGQIAPANVPHVPHVPHVRKHGKSAGYDKGDMSGQCPICPKNYNRMDQQLLL